MSAPPERGGLGRRGLARVISHASWGEILLGFRIVAWSLLMPTLRRALPLPVLTRMLSGRAWVAPRCDLDRKSASLVGWILPTRGSNCVTRSLVLYRMLSARDRDVALVLGMRRVPSGWTGHAWVAVEGRPLAETPGALRQFTPVVAFGPWGHRRRIDSPAGGRA